MLITSRLDLNQQKYFWKFVNTRLHNDYLDRENCGIVVLRISDYGNSELIQNLWRQWLKSNILKHNTEKKSNKLLKKECYNIFWT